MAATVLNTPFAHEQCLLMVKVFAAVRRAVGGGQAEAGPLWSRIWFQLDNINRRLAALERQVGAAVAPALPAPAPPRPRHSLVETLCLQRECKALLEGGATYEKTARVLAQLAGRDAFSSSGIGRYARRLRLGPKPHEPQSPEAKWVATMIAKGAADSEIAKHIKFLLEEDQR